MRVSQSSLTLIKNERTHFYFRVDAHYFYLGRDTSGLQQLLTTATVTTHGGLFDWSRTLMRTARVTQHTSTRVEKCRHAHGSALAAVDKRHKVSDAGVPVTGVGAGTHRCHGARLWGSQTDQIQPLVADKIQRQSNSGRRNQKRIYFSEADAGKEAGQDLKDGLQRAELLPGLWKDNVGRRWVGLCPWAEKVKWILSWGRSRAGSCRRLQSWLLERVVSVPLVDALPSGSPPESRNKLEGTQLASLGSK